MMGISLRGWILRKKSGWEKYPAVFVLAYSTGINRRGTQVLRGLVAKQPGEVREQYLSCGCSFESATSNLVLRSRSHSNGFVVDQSLSLPLNFATPWTTAQQASLSYTTSESLLKLTSIASVMPSNHLILCHPLLLLPSIFPRIRVFPKSRFFPSGGQSIGASPSAPVLPMINRGWFPFGSTGLTSLLSKGLSRVFSSTIVQKHQLFGARPSLWTNSHIHTWLLEKPELWVDGLLSGKWCVSF